MSNLICYCDGGSLNNQSDQRVGYGSFLIGDERPIRRDFGNVTNNEAEYMALINCIHTLHKRGIKNAIIHSDSQLVVNQLVEGWKVKSPRLRKLWIMASSYLAKMPGVILKNVPRDVVERHLGH